MRIKKILSKHSKGQIMVLYAGVIAGLLGVTALGVDVAVMYFNWAQLQKAADAAEHPDGALRRAALARGHPVRHDARERRKGTRLEGAKDEAQAGPCPACL